MWKWWPNVGRNIPTRSHRSIGKHVYWEPRYDQKRVNVVSVGLWFVSVGLWFMMIHASCLPCLQHQWWNGTNASKWWRTNIDCLEQTGCTNRGLPNIHRNITNKTGDKFNQKWGLLSATQCDIALNTHPASPHEICQTWTTEKWLGSSPSPNRSKATKTSSGRYENKPLKQTYKNETLEPRETTNLNVAFGNINASFGVLSAIGEAWWRTPLLQPEHDWKPSLYCLWWILTTFFRRLPFLWLTYENRWVSNIIFLIKSSHAKLTASADATETRTRACCGAGFTGR